MRSEAGIFRDRRRALGAALLAATALLGCGTGEVKAPNPTRSLDERRAIEVIGTAIKNEGATPAPGRDGKLTGKNKSIHIDVGVEGKDYGIAYLSEDEAAQIADPENPRDRNDKRLRLVRAGDDGQTQVVLLYQDSYLYDDLAGEGHEQTTISCERALTRDVQDFITRARTQKYR